MTQTTTGPRSYDESLLLPLQPIDIDFARTWVRQFLRDYPEVKTGGLPAGLGQPTRTGADVWPEFSRSDTAIEAALSLDAAQVIVDGTLVPFYRPHFTAARMYLGDPELWRTRSVDGSSETRRDPQEVILAWLNQGRAFDALSGLTLPPFVTVTEAGPGVSLVPGVPIVVSGL